MPENGESPEAAAPYPGFWQAVGLLFVYGVFIEVVKAPFSIADKSHHTTMATHPAVLGVAFLVAGCLVLWLVCRRLGVGVREIVGVAPIRLDYLLPMAAAVIGALMFELPCILWIVRRFPALMPPEMFDLGRSAWGAILLAAIAAPLIEEIIFRGIFLRGFVARYGTKYGVVVGAALFAAMHFFPVKIPGTMMLGLLFGWWFVEVRSIWPGVFGHALNNSVALVAVLCKPARTPEALPEFSWAEPAAATIGATVLACGVLVLRGKFRVSARKRASIAAESATRSS